MIWQKSSAGLRHPIDAVVFDVDGVLIDDTVSYYAAIKATVEYVIRALYRASQTDVNVTDQAIMAFKAAGGFNDDWVLAYTICGLLLNGAARGEADLIELAAQSAGRGMPWLRAQHFASLDLDHDLVQRVGMEHYWGADQFQRAFSQAPAHYHGPGYVRLEKSLVSEAYWDQLRAAGVQQLGLITGRNTVELHSALKTLNLERSNPFTFMLDSTQLRKPDPQALAVMLDTLAPSGALYIGDTGDDLKLVLNYRQYRPRGVPCLAAIVAKAGQRELFQEAGADLVMDAATELPAALRALRAPA